MRAPGELLKKGVHSLPCIGDGRQSGTSGSPSILNASPEAAAGGGLALLKDGDRVRIELTDDLAVTIHEPREDLLDFNELLERLAREDAAAAELVKLRVFAGLTVEEAGEVLGMSRTLAYENWKFARAWFKCAGEPPSG